jgi:hypothetical protein
VEGGGVVIGQLPKAFNSFLRFGVQLFGRVFSFGARLRFGWRLIHVSLAHAPDVATVAGFSNGAV